MKQLILTSLFFALTACGGGESVQELSVSETGGALGYVHLNVSNAKGAIAQYRLEISGEGMETVEKSVSAGAGGVEIQGIPAGKARTLRLQALNGKGVVLREGVLENLEIRAGEIQTLELKLEALPVVLNLDAGDYQSNRRLYFHILSDPGHRIGVSGFQDSVTGASEKTAGADGSVRFYPGILPGGEHTFEIVDFDNGKTFHLSLRLWEGLDVAPAPFVAASRKDASRMGQALVGEETFWNVKEVLWNGQ